jgi:hypothetical protein
MKLLTTIILGLSLFAFTSCAHKSSGTDPHHDGAAKKSCEGKDKKSCALKKKSDCKDGSCSMKKGEKKACCKKKK